MTRSGGRNKGTILADLYYSGIINPDMMQYGMFKKDRGYVRPSLVLVLVRKKMAIFDAERNVECYIRNFTSKLQLQINICKPPLRVGM